jgi:hypothetical protein
MTTILIKKKDTAGAPAAGDLTNAAGGAEIAVNTATKRIYTKDSGGNVVEVGTNPTATTMNGNLTFVPDATYDIGASGATRPRDVFMSRNLTVGGTMTVAGGINFNGNVTVGDSSADTLTINSTITSNLIFTDATYDIGASGANRPRDLFLSRNLTVGGTLTLVGGVNLNGNVTIGDSSADTLTVNSTITSNLIFTDNTYDIGASGATRPRTLYLGTSLITPSITNSSLTSGRVVYTTTGGQETSSANLLYSGGDLTIFGITAGRGTNAIATNTAFGVSSLFLVTTGFDNTAIGYNAGGRVSSGNYNVLLGRDAGQYITTGNYNIFIGVGSGTTSANPISGITAVGSNTGKVVTGRDNTFIGANAGEALTTGNQNVFIGTYNQTLLTGSGGLMTTGSANAIFGNFNGNQNSLDIRTASNWIVLSDGDGNPRGIFDNDGDYIVGTTTATTTPDGSFTMGGSKTHIYGNSSANSNSTAFSAQKTTLWIDNNCASTNSEYAKSALLISSYEGAGSNPGPMARFYRQVFPSAPARVFEVNFLGNIGLGDTNASTSGTGITFPATQAASSNANTLDDYEEGTWTPTFLASTNPTYTFTNFLATYTKIGRMVTLSLRFTISSASGGSGSTLQIGGFPFTVDSGAGNSYTGSVGWNQNGSWNVNQPNTWEAQGGANAAYLHYINSVGATFDMDPTTLQAGATFEGSITYAASS